MSEFRTENEGDENESNADTQPIINGKRTLNSVQYWKLPMANIRVFVKHNSNKFYRFPNGTYKPQKLESIPTEALVFADKFLFEVPKKILGEMIKKKGTNQKKPSELEWDEKTPLNVKRVFIGKDTKEYII